MTREARHIVQGYVTGKRGRLLPADPLPVRSVAAARSLAEKLFETGRWPLCGGGRFHGDERRANTACASRQARQGAS